MDFFFLNCSNYVFYNYILYFFQVELCLVGYALEVKIKVLQLTKFNTEVFEIIYPADHKRDWHEITLMTDDNRHYNIPVIAK